jgi:hypothetical protein
MDPAGLAAIITLSLKCGNCPKVQLREADRRQVSYEAGARSSDPKNMRRTLSSPIARANSRIASAVDARQMVEASLTSPTHVAPGLDQSRFAFSCIAACSFLMSAGDNCGRSTLIVSLLNFAVSGNGGL